MRKLAIAILCIAPAAGAQTVKVHLDAPPQVAVEEDAYWSWIPVCRAPCDRELDARGIYRIGGHDVTHKRIDITPRPGTNALAIHVEPGSYAANLTGTVLTPVGAGAVVAGLVLSIGGGDWATAGITTAIAGAVMGFIGAALLSASQTTVMF
jgi:hypothetical protein